MAERALVQVFLDSTAVDTDGVTVGSHQGSFRTVADPATVAPAVIAVTPLPGTVNVPLNAIIALQTNVPVDPRTVTSSTFGVFDNVTGRDVFGSRTVSADGLTVTFVPNAPLEPLRSYVGGFNSGVTDLAGNPVGCGVGCRFPFTTGNTADVTPPLATLVSPPDGSVNVPVNADIHVRFNEPVNPLTVNGGTIQVSGGGQTAVVSSLSFSSGNQEVVLTPQEPLPDNTLMSITISGVQDLAGNGVISRSTQFTTGAGPATSGPVVVRTNPVAGAVNVATNTVIALQTSVPVDPGSVNAGSFEVFDNVLGQDVSGSYSVSADGQTITFVPAMPLAVLRSYRLLFSSGRMTDLAGNGLTCGVRCNFNFTTGTAADAAAPTVVGVSPADQLTGVPINTQVMVQFSEPVDELTLGQVSLSNANGSVPAVATLSNGQQTLVLFPVLPLTGGTQYTVRVSGVQDLSGNVLGTPVVSAFTTAPGADLISPRVLQVTPANGAVGVPVNAVVQVRFNKPVNPLTVTPATLRVLSSDVNVIPGSITVSADGLTAQFTPDPRLITLNQYTVRTTTGIMDLIGQSVPAIVSSFRTQDGVITTVVGGGTPLNNVPAVSGHVGRPRGVVADKAGNFYISSAGQTRIYKVDSSGIMTIFAGNGTASATGDGGPAAAAGLFMRGLAMDQSGNLFIADPNNHNIRRVDAITGTISTVAGNGIPGFSGDGGPARSAELFGPNSIAVDKAGNLLIADLGNQRIRRVDGATAVITTLAGTGVAGFSGDGGPASAAQLNFAQGVAVDTSGNVFIGDSSNHRVRRVDVVTGIITTVAGIGTGGSAGDGGPATSAGLRNPRGLVVDALGNLYIADFNDQRVRRVDGVTGVITTFAGTGVFGFSGDGGAATSAAFNGLEFLTLDNSGGLLITDTSNHRIRRVDIAAGTISTVAGDGSLFTGDGLVATAADLNFPESVRVDNLGRALIADTNLGLVRRVDSSASLIASVAGDGAFQFFGDGGPATSAALNNPVSAATDLLGNLFISDFGNNRVRRIDAISGIITTAAGNGTVGFSGDSGPAIAAALNGPEMTVADGAGNLFIAEQNNQRIRRVDALTGIITTVAGSALSGFAGDDKPATSAQLGANGLSLIVDQSGNLVIVDSGNNRVRRVDAITGIIRTIAGSGVPGFSGDGGQATGASLNGQQTWRWTAPVTSLLQIQVTNGFAGWMRRPALSSPSQEPAQPGSAAMADWLRPHNLPFQSRSPSITTEIY